MKIDYKKLEKEYMTSNASVNSLATKHKVSKSALARYAKDNGWAEKREEKGKERTKREISKAIDGQDDAWQKIKAKMYTALSNEWDKFNSGQSDIRPGELVRATKDAREMGVFGVTMAEKKLIAEIDKLQKELNASDTDKSITIEIVGGDDFSK